MTPRLVRGTCVSGGTIDSARSQIEQVARDLPLPESPIDLAEQAQAVAAVEAGAGGEQHRRVEVPVDRRRFPDLDAGQRIVFGIRPEDLDAVAYSYDPELVRPGQDGLDARWEDLRTTYARRAPNFLSTALPGLDPDVVRYVPHHIAHAASAGLAAPFRDSAVLVADGRGETDLYDDAFAGDDAVAVGPDADFRDQLLSEDGLGGSDAVGGVVEEADGGAGGHGSSASRWRSARCLFRR